ncbi:MAG: hypothetical protein JWQ34_906 [Mucilaginibacter sp.]|uniref:hypothetical protein n=1 Tax=Mucilaginibacter sp. TaxID=1882438 RepID=UPI00261AEAC3|nr:hypothetical protein [Mucilaginibacter sp.]MDB5002681.1 hypothetical protein [Mucilaginibacter sp.]
MKKRILITLILLVNTALLYAQSYSAKDLVGRWQSSRFKNSNIIFTSDTTGAWLDKGGFVLNRFKYIPAIQKVGDRQMNFKFTTQLNRKKPSFERGYIKFLNDSVILLRINSWDIPKDADTTNKKVGVYLKIKQPMTGTEMHLPIYKDLLGQWGNSFKGKISDHKFIFVDDKTVYYKDTTHLIKLRYVVDFRQQPIPVDFYSGQKLVKQMYLGFYTTDRIRIQSFNNYNRGGHFNVFGNNAFFVREKKEFTFVDQY